jgi:uncharacterized protein YndB with AHSA1/START domain
MNALSGQPAPDDGDLHFTRVFAAPRELVFQCMTQPQHLTHFWAPLGSSTPVEHIRIDPRPGGIFETLIVSDADGSTYATHSVFLEVEEPDRLVWREDHTGMTVYVNLTSLPDGKTELHIHQTNVPAFVRLPENQTGFKTSLDKFANYIDQLAERRQS